MDKRVAYNTSGKNKGTTIVEMLVCFVLLGILMVAASQLLTSSMKTYSAAKRAVAGREAADLVADYVEGLLESASVTVAMQPNVTDNNSTLIFWDKDRRKASITCNAEGYLDVIYGNGTDESTHWKFDPGVYRGYKIASMKFMLPEPEERTETEPEAFLDNTLYDSNIIKLELVVESSQNGQFSTERYIRFGNIR